MSIRDDITGDSRLLFIGDDKNLEFEVFTQSGSQTGAEAVTAGVMEDVSGFTLRFELRKSASASDPSIVTKTTSGGGITISGSFNAARASNTQRVIVAIEDSDTYDLPARGYQYTLKRMDAGFENTLAFGALDLVKGTVR